MRVVLLPRNQIQSIQKQIYMKSLTFRRLPLLLGALMLFVVAGFAQVTSGSISGVVFDNNKEALIGATVLAVHTPSGTRYGTSTDEQGNYILLNVRTGGPYTISATYVGYQDYSQEEVFVSLGSNTVVDIKMIESSVTINEIVVSSAKNDIISSKKTGAGATLGREALERMPTIGRTINDITKLNPFSNGRSFGGQDNRLNNFTIDGAAFNNGFGLGNEAQAGGRTNSTAISLDALEEVQINIAPFDVRQSGFAGAGINAVTRSGTNQVSGSAYFFRKQDELIGNSVNGITFTPLQKPNTFENTAGFRLGFPLIKNKLFIFLNGEQNKQAAPATTWFANRPGATGQVSRTTAADLDKLSDFMKTNFNYITGPYEGFNNEVSSRKGLVRLDYNLNDKNKLSIRYAHHDSESDAIISNSTSAGNGNRTNSATALSFQNSGYIIQDNTRSIVGEWNSTLAKRTSNSLLITYNKQIEDRKYRTDLFPTVDILNGGSTYTSVGFDPFTPSNKLNYTTLNITDNLSYQVGKHNFVFGAAFEAFKSNNLFYPASNGVYVYNSLDDFYAAANAYKANPNNTTSPVNARFQLRYSALAGGIEPIQVLEVNKTSAYIQDQFSATKDLKLTFGVRGDVIAFGNTALENKVISAQTFRDENGNPMKINTGNLPKASLNFSPRFGFNWDVNGAQNTQVRGGTGVFLSSLPYVWISNQVGNNGVLTGFLDQRNTKAYPFDPNPARFRPTGELDLSKLTFDINATQEDFRFPQVWKSNIGIDHRLGGAWVASVEFLYNKTLNAIKHIQANLEPTTNKFSGPDTRLRYLGSGAANAAKADSLNRINDNVVSALVFRNTSEGYFYSLTGKIERPLGRKFGAMLAYTYGVAKDLANAGATASESFNSIFAVNGSNKPTLAYANNDLRHRVVGYVSYVINYGGKLGGSTVLSLSGIASSGYKVSYSVSGDLNGDGVTNNELIYVPNKASDLRFADITGSAPFTAAQQAAAYDAYIDQDDYLSTRRGQYAERNGGYSPWLTRFDLSAEQEIFIKIAGKKNSFKVRMDLFNAGNVLNDKWGVANSTTAANRPLNFVRVDPDGVPVYRLATQVIDGKTVLLKDSFTKSINTGSAWAMQLGVRYTFN